jgi:pimeloyl-ACP methyl ester carboxylesterase
MQLAECGDWPRATVDHALHDPVASDVPVLAIAGDRDPVTPPVYAERATRRMPHAQIVRVPALAHEPDIGGDCLLAIETAFLRAPFAPVDASCAAAIRWPAPE